MSYNAIRSDEAAATGELVCMFLLLNLPSKYNMYLLCTFMFFNIVNIFVLYLNYNINCFAGSVSEAANISNLGTK